MRASWRHAPIRQAQSPIGCKRWKTWVQHVQSRSMQMRLRIRSACSKYGSILFRSMCSRCPRQCGSSSDSKETTRPPTCGAGLIGLRHFAAFLNLMPEGEGLAVDPSEADDPLVAFPWSIASINCTAMLLTYLQLAPKLTCAFLPGGRCECSNDTLRLSRPLSFSESDDSGSAQGAAALVQTQLLRCLQAMHARLLIYLKDLWKQMRRAEPKTNLMDFPAALQATHSPMRRVLSTGGAAWLHPWRASRRHSVLICLISAASSAAMRMADGSQQGGCVAGRWPARSVRERHRNGGSGGRRQAGRLGALWRRLALVQCDRICELWHLWWIR